MATQLDVIAGPCPCTDCRHAPRCATKHLACERFTAFVSGFAQPQWKLAPCCPTTARFAALFPDPAERERARVERIERLRQARLKKARARAHPAQRVELAAG